MTAYTKVVGSSGGWHSPRRVNPAFSSARHDAMFACAGVATQTAAAGCRSSACAMRHSTRAPRGLVRDGRRRGGSWCLLLRRDRRLRRAGGKSALRQPRSRPPGTAIDLGDPHRGRLPARGARSVLGLDGAQFGRLVPPLCDGRLGEPLDKGRKVAGLKHRGVDTHPDRPER